MQGRAVIVVCGRDRTVVEVQAEAADMHGVWAPPDTPSAVESARSAGLAVTVCDAGAPDAASAVSADRNAHAVGSTG